MKMPRTNVTECFPLGASSSVHLLPWRGDPGNDPGVIGHSEDGSDGELALECSYECECDRGGVWQMASVSVVRHPHWQR